MKKYIILALLLFSISQYANGIAPNLKFTANDELVSLMANNENVKSTLKDLFIVSFTHRLGLKETIDNKEVYIFDDEISKSIAEKLAKINSDFPTYANLETEQKKEVLHAVLQRTDLVANFGSCFHTASKKYRDDLVLIFAKKQVRLTFFTCMAVLFAADIVALAANPISATAFFLEAGTILTAESDFCSVLADVALTYSLTSATLSYLDDVVECFKNK